MAVSFISSGYIEVMKNGQLVSRHRVEREAIESCCNQGNGRYEIRYPVVRVEVQNRQEGIISGEIRL